MTRPVLLCQGFQRAFIEPGRAMFSHTASLRRGTAERVLGHARRSGWRVVHLYLESDVLEFGASATIDGFGPRPLEPYFRQRTVCAFDTPGFRTKLESLGPNPIFFMSLAGVAGILSTLFAAIEARFPMFVVVDAIADPGRPEVSEDDCIAAVTTVARALGRDVQSEELVAIQEPSAYSRSA
jgi:nicotinamidase-related amidase